jgi:ribosomal protein L18
VRKTNTSTIVQVINASVIGDSTVASAISTELTNHGWVAGTGNIPSAYLTGLLAGLRAKSRGVKTAILDVGLNPPVKGSRVYAALKGAVDAGLEIPFNPEVIPDESRLTMMFSALGKKKTTISTIPKKFKTVKKVLEDIPATELKKKKKRKATPKAKPKAAKPKKEKPSVKPPRAIPRKPKPKKLIARGKGKKGKRRT